MEYHTRVSVRMATHLALTLDNLVKRPSWLSAGMLVHNAYKAQEAARVWQAQLLHASMTSATPYEKAWLTDAAKMDELGNFCDRPEPCVVWRGQGAYSNMCAFLLHRFGGVDDSVISAEAVY